MHPFVRLPETTATIDYLRTFFSTRDGSAHIMPYTDRGLNVACGGDPRLRPENGGAYHIVKAARDALIGQPDLIFIDVIEGRGLYRVPNYMIADVVRRNRLKRIRRQVRRGQRELGCANATTLTPSQTAAFNATALHLAAINHVSKPSVTKRIETDVLAVDPAATAQAALLTLAQHVI